MMYHTVCDDKKNTYIVFHKSEFSVPGWSIFNYLDSIIKKGEEKKKVLYVRNAWKFPNSHTLNYIDEDTHVWNVPVYANLDWYTFFFFWEFRVPIRKVWHHVFFLYDIYLHMTNRTLLLSNVFPLSLKKCQQLARTATIECKLECKHIRNVTTLVSHFALTSVKYIKF